jgi:hypothetical protein
MCVMFNSSEYMGHSWWQLFFDHKCGSMGSERYVFENLYHVLVDVNIGGCVCVQECIHILHAEGVLLFLVGSSSVWSETVFICENNNSRQQKCVRVPCKSMWCIGWLLIFISDSCSMGYRHSEMEVRQLLICLAMTILCWFTQTCH